MSLPDAETLYVALVGDPKRMRQLRRLTYRCVTDRCLLLDAVQVADTVLLHQKVFKNSHEVNQRRSNEAGRKANTVDGDRHWKPWTYYIGQSALGHPEGSGSMAGQSLQCDHVGVTSGGSDFVLSVHDFHADWAAGHAEVQVRGDGSRYAVR